MVIEHSFVTTLPPEQVMSSASGFLADGGFEAEVQGAFAVGQAGWTSLQMRRGRKTAVRAKDPTECPQTVRLDYDRGRVSVAAVIEPPANRNTSFMVGGLIGYAIATRMAASGKASKPHGELMIAIAAGLDDLLAHGLPADQARANWAAVEAAQREKARKARRRSYVFLAVFLTVIVGLIVTVAVLASHDH